MSAPQTAAAGAAESVPLALSAAQARVLGTLVEKALTTPGQYPLTLNALVSGCNQKNNRDPVTNFDEDLVLSALDGLRRQQLAAELFLSGSRVAKYRHHLGQAMGLQGPAVAVFTELLLRGPQAPGELRANASRMAPIDTLEACLAVLEGLVRHVMPSGATVALVRQLPRRPGERAARWTQLVCPAAIPAADGHDADGAEESEDEVGESAAGEARASGASHVGAASGARSGELAAANAELVRRVEQLERQVSALRGAIAKLAADAGLANPLA